MSDIQNYYMEFIERIVVFFRDIILGFIDGISSGNALEADVLLKGIWLVLTVAAVLWVLFGLNSLPKFSGLFIVLCFPLVGILLLAVIEGIYRWQSKKGNAVKWDKDADIVNGYLVAIPFWVAFGVYLLVLLFKLMNYDIPMEGALATAWLAGIICLIIMVPVAFCKLRESEMMIYIGDSAEVTKVEQMDARLIHVVSKAPVRRAETDKPVISQSDLEEDEEQDLLKKEYYGYRETQLQGMFLWEEQKVQHVAEDIYHVEYKDVGGQKSSFAIKSRSNIGTLLIAVDSVLILSIFFTPFLLYAFEKVEQWFA